MAVGRQPRVIAVPESFFIAIGTRLLKDFGPNAAENVLYELGRDAGHTFVAAEERNRGHPIRDEAGIRDLLRKFSSEYRWADVELDSLDLPAKFAIIAWRDGIGVPKGGRRSPVCHLGRGLLSGAAEVIFGVACDAIETRCQAMGHEHCEIVVGVPNRVAHLAEELE